MKNLSVDPTRRGEGIGTAICTWLESAAQEAGYARIYLGVDTENDRARDLYVRLGYQPIGETTTVGYAYVDDAGITRTATETSDYYEKYLPA